jgi:D-serine deaminase-like pyridoxal phosphate-dependent protein
MGVVMELKDYLGKKVDALPSPALVVDVAGLDANLRLLADYFAPRPAKLRPHFKSHKCVTLARRQLAAGSAVGITCAKLAEAEVLVAGGVTDVLIANQVVSLAKARRLAALNRRATVRAAVDCPAQVAELGAAARELGVEIGLLVEVDLGMKRCGVAPGAATLELARLVARTPGLRCDGLQGYEGHIVTLPDVDERRRRTVAAMTELVQCRQLLESNGVTCPIVSGGGTGTYDITGNVPGVDEVQAGSYALMDAAYHKIRPEFACCRWVAATVISATEGRAVADVGVKGMGCDFGTPRVLEFPTAEIPYVAEEHTPLRNVTATVGQRVRLIPSHGCTTNNLHRHMWISRAGIVKDLWPIEGSGCLE